MGESWLTSCVCVQEGPGEAAVAALGQASETPERLWNMSMAMTTADELAALAASARRTQVLSPPTWTSPHTSCELPAACSSLGIGDLVVK